MLRSDRAAAGGQAVLEYSDSDFRILKPGSYVRCAVTAEAIPLDELKYWSVARQEPYVDATASLEAEKRAGALPNQRR